MARLSRRHCRARSITGTLVLLVVGLVLSACQADIQVSVNANYDGAGSVSVTVTLDRQAATYASDVEFSDLTQAGWSVTGPKPSADGAVVIVASRSFSTPAQGQALIAQLSGAGGPFHGLSLDVDRSFFHSSTTFQGTVDLACGIDCFADPQLQHTLGGSTTLGIDPAALKNDAGIDVNGLVTFGLVARLPGTVSSNAAGPPGSEARWSLPLGKSTEVMASSQAWNVAHLVEAAVAAFVLLVSLVLGGWWLLWRRRKRRSTRPAHKHRRAKAVTPAS